jgi:hypothetical protein
MTLHAIKQRERAHAQSYAEAELKKAAAGDRQAKKNLKKKLEKKDSYIVLPKTLQKAQFEQEIEEIMEQRFRKCQSGIYHISLTQLHTYML